MTTQNLREGTRVGPYVIRALLGRGGMGAVYRAADAAGREVALKVLFTDSADDRSLARFRREAQAGNLVRHPNVASILAAGTEGTTPWIALDLLTGGSLDDRLKRSGALPWREAAAVSIGVARGLGAVHAAGYVHRDLKPANVLLDARGEPRVADFGVVRRPTATSVALTATGEVVGTPTYAAPEQLDQAKAVDARADLYAFGVLLFTLVAGRPPFLAQGYAIVKQHLLERPPALRSLVADVPAELDALVAGLLAKKPHERPTLEKAIATLEGLAARTEPARRSLALPAVAGALVLVAAGVFLATRTHEPGPTPPPPIAPVTTRVAPPPPPPPPPRVEWAATEHPPEAGKLASRPGKRLELRGVLGTFRGKHAGGVNGLVLTPERDLAISAGSDCTVRAFDPVTLEQRWTLRLPTDEPLGTLAISRNGTHLAVGGPGGIWVYDLRQDKTREPVHLDAGPPPRSGDPSPRHAFGVAISSDGRLVFSAHRDKKVRLWSVADPRWVKDGDGVEPGLGQSSIYPSAVAFAPDDRRAFSCGTEESARVWDVSAQGLRFLQKLPLSDTSHPALAISADGRRLVAGSERGTLDVVPLDGGEARAIKVIPEARIQAVELSADGSRALVGFTNGESTRVVDLATGKLGPVLEGSRGASAFGFLDDRRALVASTEHSVTSWDVRTGVRLSPRRGHDSLVLGLAFSPDGTRLASAGYDRRVLVWDLATGAEAALLEEHAGPVSCVAYAAGGRLVSAGWDRQLRRWTPSGWGSTAVELGGEAVALAVSPDAEQAVVALHDGAFQHQEPTGKLNTITPPIRWREIPQEDGSSSRARAAVGFTRVEFGPLRGTAVSWDGADLRTRDLKSDGSWQRARRHDQLAEAAPVALAIGHDLRRSFVGSVDRDHHGFLGQLSSSKDGSLTPAPWNGARHKHLVTAVALSADSGLVASGSPDKHLAISTADRGDLVDEVVLAPDAFDHPAAIAFSPDGQAVAVGTGRGAILLFRLRK